MNQSEEEWDWLGFGFYFWEDSPARAWLWCDEKQYPAEEGCILDAEISLIHCLNLADPEGIAKIAPMYRLYVEQWGEEHVARLKETDRFRQLDCRVINFACQQWAEEGYEVHVVRGAFEEGRSVFEGYDSVPASKIRRLNHVQLAVRNADAILDMRIEDRRPVA